MTTLLVGSVPALLLAVLSLRWLRPQLPDRMRLPVLAYILVICTMLTLAAATWGAAAGVTIIVGAWGFAISDLSVARNQFVVRSHWNRLWGLPLYFTSQMLLAWTVRLVP